MKLVYDIIHFFLKKSILFSENIAHFQFLNVYRIKMDDTFIDFLSVFYFRFNFLNIENFVKVNGFSPRGYKLSHRKMTLGLHYKVCTIVRDTKIKKKGRMKGEKKSKFKKTVDF